MKDYFTLLAHYNLWATQRLYQHLEAVPEAEYRAEAGLFFHSIHGTLNHLLVAGDLIWYQRFALAGSPTQVDLAQELHTQRAALQAALLHSAERWCELVQSFAPERFSGLLQYTTLRGTAVALPFAATLGHVFNHGTHHRGQITAALTARGHGCPELDWVYMLQQQPATHPVTHSAIAP